MSKWEQDQYDINEYDTHKYYRAMDYLHNKQEEVEDDLFNTMKSHSKLKHDFSKERRSDLKQVVVGLALSEDGVPLSHEVFSGNTNDQTCFKKTINKFWAQYTENNITFVRDRDLISGKNIDLLIASGYSYYILGFKM